MDTDSMHTRLNIYIKIVKFNIITQKFLGQIFPKDEIHKCMYLVASLKVLTMRLSPSGEER